MRLSLFVVFMLSLSQGTFSQALKGLVQDVKGNPVAGVKISINQNGFSQSDENGYFLFSTPAHEINNIQAHKRGYQLSGYDKSPGENLSLTVNLARTEFTLMGKTFDEKGEVLAGAEVVLQPQDPVAKTRSNQNGIFQIKVPPFVDITPSTKFTVNGTPIPSEYIKMKTEGDILHLQLPPKQIHLTFFDAQSTPTPNLTFTYGGKVYTTDGQGRYKMPIPEPESAVLAFEGYTETERNYMPNDGHLLIYLKAANPAPTEEARPDQGGDEEVAEAPQPTEKGTEYDQEFNTIINELEMRKQNLIEESTIIRKEMEQVAMKLAQESELSNAEKRELEEYMNNLESKLIETDVAYENAQVETKQILDKMRKVIVVKDSIYVAAEEQLEVVTHEKEAVEAEKNRNLIVFSVLAVSLLAILGIIWQSNRRVKKSRNELRSVNTQLASAHDSMKEQLQKINAQKAEIELQAKELYALNMEVSNKNTKLTDNIRYALTVQEAILPSHSKITDSFKDFFVIFRPKDIVSGDFYFHAQISTGEQETTTFLAAVDCTGHGVSGAFMSMIGSALLNEIINQKHIHDPADILFCLNEGVVERLQQQEKSNDDGMDIALCKVVRNGKATAEISFAGAKRPLYYVRENSQKVEIVKGDRSAIGGIRKKAAANFHTQTLELSKNDKIYLCSDGLADQNNENRKKFGTQRLLQFLSENAHLPMQQQQEKLEKTLDLHQGPVEQRDDILMIGICV